MPVVFNNPQSICDGSSYSNNGNTYTVAGIYLDTLNAANGCDSIVVTDLTVNPVTNSNEIASICSGQSYSFGGSNLTTSGNYNYTYSSIYGCDSIVTLDLTVVDTIKVTMSASICEGQSYTFGSQTLIAAGAYTDLSVSAGGCDSLTTLLFTVNSKDSIGMVESICEGSSYLFNGDLYSNDTIITANLMNINGCDSLVTLALSIIPTQITAASAAICANGSYLFGGTNLSSAGSYSHTFIAVNGCDSVVNLDLNVYATHSENISASICEGQSYSFGGNNYNLTGVYSHTVNNMAGCDSTTTLTLTVNEIDSLVLDVQVCMGGSYVVDGNSHNTTGTYVHTMNNITGCDSVVTLNLTVVDTIKVTLYASVCEGQSYTFGAQTLSTSGTYTDLSTSLIGGCDSVTTLYLTINTKDSLGMSTSICNGDVYLFNGVEYSTSGMHSVTLTNLSGCDSIVTLDLTVNDLPIVDFTFNQDSICDYDSPITLSATPSGGVFSGVGVVGNSFNPYGFSVAGYASVQYVYSDFNGCTSTSTDSIFVDICIGITSNNNSKIGVYPNPNRGLFKMVNANSSAEYIEITNAFGAIVYKGFTSDGGVVNIQNLAPGVYTLQSKNEHIKIVKE